MKKIIDLKAPFSWIQCFHIHRQFNFVADSLSKLGLGKEFGWMYFEEVQGDSVIDSCSFYIFIVPFQLGSFVSSFHEVFVFALILQSIVKNTYLV